MKEWVIVGECLVPGHISLARDANGAGLEEKYSRSNTASG